MGKQKFPNFPVLGRVQAGSKVIARFETAERKHIYKVVVAMTLRPLTENDMKMSYPQLVKLIDLCLLQFKVTGHGYPHDLIREAMKRRR